MLSNDLYLSLSGVSLFYGRRNILSDVNLSLYRGDILAVTGPNGGGKTSLVRIMLGLLAPTSGSVRCLNGGEKTPADVGYLPQKNSMDMRFPITLEEMVESGLVGCGVTDAAARRSRVADALEVMELTHLRKRQIGEVSGGQFQRALMARALIGEPELLVLDEPTSYMDAYFEEKVFDILKGVSGKCTVVMVSHAVDKVRRIASRLVSVNRTVTEIPL